MMPNTGGLWLLNGFIKYATSQGNRFLNLTSEMIYQYSLCAERITVSKAPDIVQLFGGSSLCRKRGKKTLKEASRKECAFTHGNDESEQIANSLRLNQATKRRNTRTVQAITERGLQYVHFLSSRSAQKIRAKLHTFYRTCTNRKTFVTLTFIQSLDDKAGQAILNKFLTQLRADYGKKNFLYLWVAERQENGNIHFHLMVNQFLPVNKYNALWVQMQYNSGLRGTTKDGRTITQDEILQAKKAGRVSKLLSPFDIKQINGVDGLSAYLTQYVTKTVKQHNEQKELVKQKKKVPGNVGFGCRVWHCSRAISELPTSCKVGAAVMLEAKQYVNYKVDYKTGEVIGEPISFSNKFAALTYINNKQYFAGKYMKALNEFCKRCLYDKSFVKVIPTINAVDYHNSNREYYCYRDKVSSTIKFYKGIGEITKKVNYERTAKEIDLIEGKRLYGNFRNIAPYCVHIPEGRFKGAWYSFHNEMAISGTIRAGFDRSGSGARWIRETAK